MKKSISLFIAVVMALSLSACGGNGGGTAEADTNAVANTEIVRDEADVPDVTNETSAAEPDAEGDPLSYYEFEEKDGGITITKYTGSADEVTIPAEIDGKPVTSIGEEAFKESEVKSVVIPDSVTVIEWRAFGDCENLESINIPNSVTRIVSDVFSGCESLKSIEIPESVVEFGYTKGSIICTSVFDESGIEEVIISPNAKWAENRFGGFGECEYLTKINIPDSFTYIEYGAFEKCESLEEIVLPESITFINSEAFASCGKLKSVNIPDGVTEIRSCAFAWCYELRSLTLPDNIEELDETAFLDCKDLIVTYKGKEYTSENKWEDLLNDIGQNN